MTYRGYEITIGNSTRNGTILYLEKGGYYTEYLYNPDVTRDEIVKDVKNFIDKKEDSNDNRREADMAIIINRNNIYKMIEIGVILENKKEYKNLMSEKDLDSDLETFGKVCENIFALYEKNQENYPYVTDFMNSEAEKIEEFIKGL